LAYRKGYYRMYPDNIPPQIVIWAKHSRDWSDWHICIEDAYGRDLAERRFVLPTIGFLRHPEVLAIVGEQMSDLLKSALAKQAVTPESQTKIAHSSFASEFPIVTEFLACNVVDGKPRQTATLYVFIHDGAWKCFLNDRETQRCITVTAESFIGLPEALEAALASDDPGWRQMAFGGTKKPKR